MTDHYEKCRLSGGELAAVLAMAGKTSMVDFQTDEPRRMDEEAFWSACCSLQRDGLLHQSGEGFCVDKVLAKLIRPMLRADRALVMTPGSDTYTQVIYYCADQVTVMERMGEDRYGLECVEMSELIDDLEERLELVYSEDTPRSEPRPKSTVGAEDPWGVLLRDASFLLEQLDLSSGQRTGWIRAIRQGLFTWLEWSWGGQLFCAPFTRQTLEERLYVLEGGAER